MKIDRNADAERISALESSYVDHELEHEGTAQAPRSGGSLLNLSRGAQAVNHVRDAVENAPAVRAARVAQLRQQYLDGTLNVDSGALSQAMEKVLRHV